MSSDAERKRLAAELRAGEAAALDPDNAPHLQAGRAVTTLQSPWLHLRCRVCGHTFRPGDAVEVSSAGEALHSTPGLPCAGGTGEAHEATAETGEFFDGVESTWPPPADLPLHRLQPGHPLLAPPVHGFRRRACAVCGHTFRVHDSVILCPCFPTRPRCMVAIHRDPVHGLHCWEDWNPGAHQLHCPGTSRKLDE